MKRITFIILSNWLLVACKDVKTDNSQPGDTITIADTSSLKLNENNYQDTDSLALLQLTRKLYHWVEEESKLGNFEPYLTALNDTVYAGMNTGLHQQRLKEISQTGLFTPSFINNYNKIALAIDKQIKNRALIWNVGELPPFGNGASPWCDCQDAPDSYADKIWIMQVSFNKDTASYNWSWGDGLVYHIKALKENGIWKVDYMEGFDYNAYIRSFVYTNQIEDSWENDLVRIDIGNETLTLWYHGQCVYFYPIRKIDTQTVEMIWDRDMDCKFDNGTNQAFGLKRIPEKGKPFAKFTLQDNMLHADYYYKEWVQQYAKQVQDDVFTSTYSRMREH